jgi:hypothetical protein
MSYLMLRTLAWAGARWSRHMTLARETAPSACQTQVAARAKMMILAPFAGYRRLGYYLAGLVLDWIDSGRPPRERIPGPMSQKRETAR